MSVGRARHLRKNQTDAERLLWSGLRNGRVDGARFRRQAPIGTYIGTYVADFCCFERRLIIELDGGQHASQRVHDTIRTRFLESQGFLVLRFWNADFFRSTDEVLGAIYEACASRRGYGNRRQR